MRSDLPPSREELARIQADLLERLASAKANYLTAKAEATKLLQIEQDIGRDHVDGRTASLNALHMQRHATERYMQALTAFNEFVLDYKLPKDLPNK